jgi:NAD/NADP transhydrogenase beta subunit
VLGVIGGALVAVGTDLVTSVAWLAAIKGAIVGGAIGTAIGALTGLTFWREEVDFLHRHLKQGSVIVGVETNAGRQSSADEALRAAGAEEVHSRKTELVVNEATSV